MKLGNCKLCQEDKQLMHSHILPEFFYEPTYDEQHKFISISSHPLQKTKPFQKGFREYLLCEKCEGQFGSYESYAATILRKTGDKFDPNDRVVKIPNFDYRGFKLFGLSVIWRCHISRLHFFSAVKLGSHAEKIRKLLVTENPGKPSEYCFAVIKIVGSKRADTVIHSPEKIRFQEHNGYFLPAYGYEWIFVTSSHSERLPKDYPFVGMKPDLEILLYPQSDKEFLNEMRRRMGKRLIDKA
jgi:hypothetical protein